MKKAKKSMLILGIIVGAFLVLLGGCGSGDDNSYDWPDTEFANMIPEPEGKITSLTFTDGENLYADVDCSLEQYKKYVEDCKEAGYTEEQDISQSGDWYTYKANNEEGYALSISYYDDMTIDFSAGSSKENAKEKKTEETTKAEDSVNENSISSDFKETMDSYEEFMDGYIAFMEKYEDSDDTIGMMSDYADMMTEYTEYMEKIDGIDEGSLSDADLNYYLEVTSRVTKKLSEASF